MDHFYELLALRCGDDAAVGQLLSFAFGQGFGTAPVGFAADALYVDGGAFDAVDADAFARFQRWFAGGGVSGPGRAEDFYRAFVKRACAGGDDGPDLSGKGVDAAAQGLT